MDKDPLIQLLRFYSDFKPYEYPVGQVVIHMDEEEIENIYFLQSGYIRQYAYSERAEEITINIQAKNTCFPLSAILCDAKNRYFYEALTTIQIRKAPKKQVLNLLKQNSSLLFSLATRFAKNLNDTNIILENIMSCSARHKILVSLIVYGKRFGKENKNRLEFPFPLTQKLIASFMGLSRETVCRELEKLCSQKLVSKQNHHLLIRDLAKIEKEIFAA